MDMPEGSIYFWCYTQGLKHVDLSEIIEEAGRRGRELRDKDVRNYWNGWHRSDLYTESDPLFKIPREQIQIAKKSLRYEDFPLHPYVGMGIPEVSNRWVPCNEGNKPIIEWSKGCMSIADAKAMRRCVYLAENMKGTSMIVIDVDGDHGGEIDLDVIERFSKYMGITHCMMKPSFVEIEVSPGVVVEYPTSYHLTFMVDRVIPTMHFLEARIDIIGNRKNSLRYIKNKSWNGVDPIPMTNGIWDDVMEYVHERKSK